MKKIAEHLPHILKNLPKTPGVYQMKNSQGKVIYVGKSVNLKSRVSSYFQDEMKLTVAKRKMVSQIADIEIILCQTEVEALTLETNIIKHLSPKYNILMKDDKNLSYIKITNTEIAEIVKTRQKINDGAKYFGPFTAGTNISATLKSLRRIFKVRDCKMKFSRENGKIAIVDRAWRGVPCMDYYIGICPAPCILKEKNIREHAENIRNFENFLSGNTHAVTESLKEKMQFFAKQREFEKAGKIKEELEAIALLTERQIARDVIGGNHDIVVMLEKYQQHFVGMTQVRNSQIIAVMRFVIETEETDTNAILSQFLARQYISENNDLPENIILEIMPNDKILQHFFKEQKIEILLPKIWPKKEILDFTRNQLREFAYKRELENLENKTLTRAHMEHILQKLHYEIPKKWWIFFECYDISHTHGQFTYASRVVMKNGKMEPSLYKKYKIKSLEKGEIDDFASHKEVMRRRTVEGLELKNFPHLLIIDWGKWQLSSAIQWIKMGILDFLERNLWNFFSEIFTTPLENILPKIQHFENIDNVEYAFFLALQFEIFQKSDAIWKHFSPLQIVSIAKREEEIFLPNTKNPVLFDKWTPELMALQKARDESHRFSITANRSARTRAMKKNILEEIPSIGPVARKKLLSLAGNVDALKNYSESELLKIINKRQLEALRDHGIV